MRWTFPGSRERCRKEAVWKPYKPPRTGGPFLPQEPLRFGRRAGLGWGGSPFKERKVLACRQVPSRVLTLLGKSSPQGVCGDRKKQKENKRARRPFRTRRAGCGKERKERREEEKEKERTTGRERSREAQRWGKAEKEEKTRKRRPRPWDGKQPASQTERVAPEDGWRKSFFKPRCGRCGVLGRWFIRPPGLHLCVGRIGPQHRGDDEPSVVKDGLWTSQRKIGGYKRWYLEEDEGPKQEGTGHRRSEEDQWTAAGNSRAARSCPEGKQEEEERQTKWKLKGKGSGSAAKRKEEEKEGRGSIRRWGELRREQQLGGEFLGIRTVSSPSAEEPEKPREGFEVAGGTCPASLGSISFGGDLRKQPRDGRSEDGHVLQPVDQAIPPNYVAGHEGASSSCDLSGRAEEWTPRDVGGQLGLEISGHPLGGERGRLEGSPVLRAPPVGADGKRPNIAAAASPEARQCGGEEPRKRRLQPLAAAGRSVAEAGRPGERQGQRRKRKGQERKRMEGSRIPMVARKRKLGKQRLLVGQGEREERTKRGGGQKGREVRGEENEERSYKRSEEAPHRMRGYEGLLMVVDSAPNLKAAGCLLVWLLVHCRASVRDLGRWTGLDKIFLGKDAGGTAVHRFQEKGIFPVRLGGYSIFLAELEAVRFSEAATMEFAEKNGHTAWCILSVQYLNFMAGCPGILPQKWRAIDRKCCSEVGSCVTRTLKQDETVIRRLSEVEKELSSRFLSYTGEEIPKLERLTLRQVLPSLPPEGHGGAIPARNWVEGRSRSFLDHPGDCVCQDVGQKLPKLQARMHIQDGEELNLALELVRKGICSWTPEAEVLRYRGEMVLNGMFGVPKDSLLPTGEKVLRLIMNLIPSNSVMVQLEGAVKELPGVCQYMSVVLDEGQRLSFSQSDMTSAFYLFGLPPQWRKYLCFNLRASGSAIGLAEKGTVYLSCAVLPMGWASAVAVMQEISQSLLYGGGLPARSQVTRLKSLPGWLSEVVKEGQQKKRVWWHVYLDNFFCGEKLGKAEEAEASQVLHAKAELAWSDAGVLSSTKKRVSDADCVDELGARFDSEAKLLGSSGGRLIGLVQTTLFVIGRYQVPPKWLQVVAGRWVHVLQFRRLGMSTMQMVWKWIGKRRIGPQGVLDSRREMLMLCLGCCLFHTHLGAQVGEVVSASDASGRGGAVGSATKLTPEGSDFLRCLKAQSEGEDVVKVPCLVVSMFNGIGGAFRCYDVLGVEPTAMISYDTCSRANRVVSRRWPHAELKQDVQDITEAEVRSWYFRFPLILAIHLWAGFPCVDLSSAKFGRQNLEGRESRLFFEILRVIRIIRQIFGTHFDLKFFVENVASMDRAAAEQISTALGVRPFRVQSSDAVPISRPRLCWTNEKLKNLPGLTLVDKDYYIEVVAKAEYPRMDQWLRDDSSWPGGSEGAVLPTCMKCIKRLRPPPRPAGLDRTDSDCRSRWVCDQYRYPPYQYKQEYIFWSPAGWRLCEASERELLHGYGFGHTLLCMSASDIKRDPQEYEDARCTLLGDSFSIFSFVIFPWSALADVLPQFTYSHLARRMGLAPGCITNILKEIPLQRRLAYGYASDQNENIQDLTSLLLGKANHTGSDIRITTGQVMVPRAFPRQSASADWWHWKVNFTCHWKQKEHINALELRSIILALQWRVRHLGNLDCRLLHLTDSYVNMSIISKGRTSSVMLARLLRKLAALCLGFSLFPFLIHVESTENPTDEGSRL